MIFRLALVAFATALLSGSAWSDDGTAAAAETDAKFLFALRGEARLDGDRLVVQTAHVDWFTDRPVRRAGRMTGEAFAGQWEEMGFDSVPPNAFLAGDVSDVVVVLTEPAATATELAFTVSKVVAGDTASGDLGSIGMFIDSADGDIGFGNTGNTNIGDP